MAFSQSDSHNSPVSIEPDRMSGAACESGSNAADSSQPLEVSELSTDGVRNTHPALNAHATGETTDGEGQGCPAPLSLVGVLQTFGREGRAWKLDRGRYVLSGHSWGEGRPLYILNGIGGSCELFAPLMWLLRDECRVVVFDYPGNESPLRGVGKLTIDDLAEDLFAVADSQGDRQFALYATSFGSLIALTALLEEPKRIERAIIQGGFAHRRLSIVERMLVELCRRLPGRYRHLPFRRTIQEQNHRIWFPGLDTSRWDYFVTNTGNVPIASLALRAKILDRADLRPRLGELTKPVLLIHSEGEGMVSAACQRDLEAGLPHACVERLTSCGHLPYLSHPHRLAKIVKSFLLDEQTTDA